MRPAPALVLAGLLLAAYAGTWAVRRLLGLVQPAANLTYVAYPGPLPLQRAVHALFYPCSRLTGERHFSFDRAPLRLEDAGP